MFYKAEVKVKFRAIQSLYHKHCAIEFQNMFSGVKSHVKAITLKFIYLVSFFFFQLKQAHSVYEILADLPVLDRVKWQIYPSLIV